MTSNIAENTQSRQIASDTDNKPEVTGSRKKGPWVRKVVRDRLWRELSKLKKQQKDKTKLFKPAQYTKIIKLL